MTTNHSALDDGTGASLPAGAQACFNMLLAAGRAGIAVPTLIERGEDEVDTLDFAGLDKVIERSLDQFGGDAAFRRSLVNYLHLTETGGTFVWDAWDAMKLYTCDGARPAADAP